MADEYKLKIVIDDTQVKDLESRLGRLMGAKSAGGGGGQTQSGGGLAGLMGGSGKEGTFKNLAKLGGIAIGITAIVGIVKKMSSLFMDASPMLQQMLKLFNFGVMMLLRPIGDFIGFLLRPIMVMLLVRFIIPFYRTALPFMQKAGDWIGTKIVPFIESIFNTLVGMGEIIVGGLTLNGTMVTRGINRLKDVFNIGIKETVAGTHETKRVGDKVGLMGVGIIRTLNDLIKSNVAGKVQQSMANLGSSRGFAGAGAVGQKMMEAFAKITGGNSKWGFQNLGNQIGGVNQSSLGIMGAGQAQIQGQISNGDFTSVQQALAAYVQYVLSAGKSTGLTDRSQIEQQFIQITVEGNLIGIDELDRHIEEVIQNTKARSNSVFG